MIIPSTFADELIFPLTRQYCFAWKRKLLLYLPSQNTLGWALYLAILHCIEGSNFTSHEGS